MLSPTTALRLRGSIVLAISSAMQSLRSSAGRPAESAGVVTVIREIERRVAIGADVGDRDQRHPPLLDRSVAQHADYPALPVELEDRLAVDVGDALRIVQVEALRRSHLADVPRRPAAAGTTRRRCAGC